jgi:catechol 2,3-dioxygenase-like lactoylglutathione lyase family enzyme
METRIAVIALWAEDVPAAAHFYRDVIGLRLAAHHGGGTGGNPHFDVNGAYLVILKGRPVPAEEAAPERFPLVAFAVEDLDQALERLRAHRVALPWGIEADGHSRWAMFHDPAGNLIELVEFKRGLI